LKTVLPICIYLGLFASFVKMAAFWVEMGVAYLEINKLHCLHEIDTYYIIKMTAPLQYSVWVQRSLKFKFKLLQPMKVKRANRLMSIIDEIWVIHQQKVDTLSMIGIYYLEQKQCSQFVFIKDCLHHLSKWWCSGWKWGWPI
jgi:hypothetical protein